MRILVGKGSEESFVSFMDKVSGNSKRVSAKGGANRAKGSRKTGRAVNRDAADRPKNAGNVHLISGQEAREREKCLHLSIFMSWLRRRAAPEVLERGLCHGGPQMRLPIALSPSFTQLICSAVTQLLFWSRLWAVELMGPGQMRMQRFTQKGGYRFFRVVSLLVNSWHEKPVPHPCLTDCSTISEN